MVLIPQLSSCLNNLGFQYLNSDISMMMHNHASIIVVFLIYFDDILVTGNSHAFIESLITKINIVFSLNYLGDLNFFFVIEVTRTTNRMHFNQSKYFKDFLDRVKLNDSKSTSTLMVIGILLSKIDDVLLIDFTQYITFIWALQYCTPTRLEISFYVNKLYHFLYS